MSTHIHKLRYDSHIIKSTILKCTVQWFLLCSQSCTAVATIYFQDISIPIKSHYPFLPSPAPGNH